MPLLQLGITVLGLSLTLMPDSPHLREQLQQHGVASLTTTELISLVLGTGTRQHPVQQLAAAVCHQLRSPGISLDHLRQIPGVGVAKACQLLAMIEFVERLRPVGFPVIDELDKVLQHLSEIRFLQREHIVCLYLNTRMQLLLKETVAVGSVNQSAVRPRDIFAAIKYHPVSYLILAHNHPSGNPQPSTEDLSFTQQLVAAAQLLGIEILDHVIVAAHQHYSLTEHGQLPHPSGSGTVQPKGLGSL